MKKPISIHKIILIVISIPLLGYSNTIMNNLSGDIGMEYLTESKESKTKTQTNKLSQILNLNYRDYIYSPKLIDYYLQFAFVNSEDDRDEDGQNKSTTFNNLEYNTKFDFFKLTDFPFEIKAKRTEKPSTFINDDSIVETIFNKDEYSLSGKYNTFFANYNYNFSTSKTKTNSELGDKKLNNTLFSFGITKEFRDESRIGLTYSEDNSDTKDFYGDFLEEVRNKKSLSGSYSDKTLYLYTKYSLKNERDKDNNSNKEYKIDNLSSTVNYTFSDTLTLANSYDVETSNRDDSTTNNASVSLRWKPTKKYNANLTLRGNEYEVKGNAFNNYSFDLFSNYKINEDLNNSQNFTYTDIFSPTSKHKSYQLTVATDYKKVLSRRSRMYLRNVLSAILNENTGLTEDVKLNNDQNYIFDLTGGVKRKFSFWSSVGSLEGNYSETVTSDATNSRKIRVSSILSTFPRHNTEYNVSADYTIENKIDTDMTALNILNNYKYVHNFDVRGNLIFDATLNYKLTSLSGKNTTGLEPKASTSFNYRLWRTLSFQSKYNVTYDKLNKTTSHIFDTGLMYKFRDLEFDITTNFIKQTKDEDQDYNSKSILLSFKRKF